MAAHSLSWAPNAPAPKFALRALVVAIAQDWFDGDAGDVVVSLVTDHDRDLESMMLFACGTPLEPNDPNPDAAQALQDHVGHVRLFLAVHDPAAHPPTLLGRYVTLTAAAHHAGDRRRAVCAMVEDGDELFAELFSRCTGVEL